MQEASGETPLARVWKVLNRSVTIDSLQALLDSLASAPPRIDGTVGKVAFGFDTNAIFRLGLGSAGDDSLDYLRSRHEGPLIVPGQTLQEVWNNQLAGVLPVAKKLQAKMSELESEAEKLDHRFGRAGELAKSSIEDLASGYAETFDESGQEVFKSTLRLFVDRASVAYVPRSEFQALADIRNDTRTPPGFKDAGHGDFFVWADFLYGLAESDVPSIEAVVLVTEDKKADWSRSGLTHPILRAEVAQIVAQPFELWTIAQLNAYVKERS